MYSKIIVCRMKDLKLTTLRSPVLLSVLFCALCVDAMGRGDQAWMNDSTVEMISLDTSQYCYVDDNTIRVDLNTTTQLNIIDSNEGVILATAVGNNTIIFIAPLNGSRCMDHNNEDDRQLITTIYIIRMIILSITILLAIANITLHLIVKDLLTISGILVLMLCTNVTVFTILTMGIVTNNYNGDFTVTCVVLIKFSYALAFFYQATKLSILYHFAYLMYQSYKLKQQEESIKTRILKYVIFIIGSSVVCFLLALPIDVAVYGNIYSDKERYCLVEHDYSILFVTVVHGILGVFIILHCITFAVGLRLYFLVSKKRAMKSTDFRVTIALAAIVGINAVLLIILTIAKVSSIIRGTIVNGCTLIEQLVLVILFLSSKKVILVCKTAFTKEDMIMRKTTQQSLDNMTDNTAA